MPLGFNPVTLLLIGVIGGLGATATYGAFHYAEKAGPKLTLTDLLPAPPWVGLPLPRFMYNPEIMESLHDIRR